MLLQWVFLIFRYLLLESDSLFGLSQVPIHGATGLQAYWMGT